MTPWKETVRALDPWSAITSPRMLSWAGTRNLGPLLEILKLLPGTRRCSTASIKTWLDDV